MGRRKRTRVPAPVGNEVIVPGTLTDNDSERPADTSIEDLGEVAVHAVQVLDWSKEEIVQLILEMQKQAPAVEKFAFGTAVHKLDWEKVAAGVSGEHTADEAREKWLEIQSKQRTFRTLSELLTDAKEWLQKPWTSFSKQKKRHPDYPKRPLTPYFRFYRKKWAHYREEYPGESVASLARLISDEYKQLSEKKQRHYKRAYEREMEEYKEKVQQFLAQHPEAATVVHRKSQKDGVPIPPLTPFKFYLSEKMENQELGSSEEKAEVINRLKQKWKKLKAKRKIRYIQMTVGDQVRYKAEVDEYKKLFPNFEPKKKRLLTLEEKKIKDEADEKPEKPPGTAYTLFCKEEARTDPDLQTLDLKSRNQELGKRWEQMSHVEKRDYEIKVQEMQLLYKQKFDEYLQSLPEEEREEATEGSKNMAASTKKRLVELEKMSADPAIAPAAYNSYQLQRQKELPHLPPQQMMTQCMEEWNEMSLAQKDQFFRRATNDSAVSLSLSVEDTMLIENMKRLQPKKPPRSGYSIFAGEAMNKLKLSNSQADTKNRMRQIAQEWKTLSPAKKEKYKKKWKKAFERYTEEQKEFKQGLDERSLHLYQKFVENKSKAKLLSTIKGSKVRNEDNIVSQKKRKNNKDGSKSPKSRKTIDDEDSDESDSESATDQFVDAVQIPEQEDNNNEDDDDDEDDDDSD